MDTTVLLSRLQFGFVISFHIPFPAFTIGLASWLAFLEAWWLRTRDDAVRDLFVFWMKIFSVSFGVGVVTGIVGLAGGLGGFLLPILFGALLDIFKVRSSCFMLMYGIVWVSLIVIYLSEVRRARVM